MPLLTVWNPLSHLRIPIFLIIRRNSSCWSHRVSRRGLFLLRENVVKKEPCTRTPARDYPFSWLKLITALAYHRHHAQYNRRRNGIRRSQGEQQRRPRELPYAKGAWYRLGRFHGIHRRRKNGPD